MKSNGAVVWSASYTAFGQATVEVQEMTNNLRFPGQYYDAETGLHYNYSRYYDQKPGRYLTADSIGLAGGLNLYRFTSNNPINLVDFYGRKECSCDDNSPKLPSCGPYPDFDWGEIDSSKGNCFRYAFDRPVTPSDQHLFPGGADPGGVLTCAQMMSFSKLEGAIDTDKDGDCPCGYWKIAVVLTEAKKGKNWNDFHYYRQESDGPWTHKRGKTKVTNKDAVNKPIVDPQKANRGKYTQFCGYLCVTKS